MLLGEGPPSVSRASRISYCRLGRGQGQVLGSTSTESTYQDRIAITRNGTPVAILISVEDLESLEETLDETSVDGASQEEECGRYDASRPVACRDP